MNVAAWIVTGFLVGLLANRLLNDGSRHGRMVYIVVGILGAIGGVQLMSPTPDPAVVDQGAFSLSMLFFSAAGAGILLFGGNALREKFFP